MHLITGCVLNPFTVAQFLVTSVRHNGSNTGFKNGYVTEGDVVFLRPSRQMTCYYITVGHGRFLLLLFNSLFTDLYVTRRYEYSDKRRPYINHTQINRRKVGLSVCHCCSRLPVCRSAASCRRFAVIQAHTRQSVLCASVTLLTGDHFLSPKSS